MPSPAPIPPKILAIVVAMVAITGCQTGSGSHPVPSVAQIGGDLKCASGDHPFEDMPAGWGFCYPGSWKYVERSQGIDSPPGLDLTFDITDDPCGRPGCAPNEGVFGYMIISTYERGSANSLADWEQANMSAPIPATEPIFWANAVEAMRLADGRRLALTPHHVVILDLHPGTLDLEAAMAQRLDTWKFLY